MPHSAPEAALMPTIFCGVSTWLLPSASTDDDGQALQFDDEVALQGEHLVVGRGGLVVVVVADDDEFGHAFPPVERRESRTTMTPSPAPRIRSSGAIEPESNRSGAARRLNHTTASGPIVQRRVMSEGWSGSDSTDVWLARH